MSLRTRIALTFLVLLTAVLAAALCAAWIAGRGNAEVAVRQRLISNQQLLTQAAQAVAYDSGFRDAVSDQDTETLVTVLENSGRRVDASMAVLTSMDGKVIAAFGSRAAAGSRFPIDALHRVGSSGIELPNVMIDGLKIYQVVAVTVKSPLPVAIIAMGFDLGEGETGLERIRGQEVSLIKHADDRWQDVVTTDPVNALPGIGVDLKALRTPVSRREASLPIGSDVSLAKSLAEANAPFDKLNALLLYIAAVSVIVFGWAAFWIARYITRPLGDLTRSVDKIRAGSYDVPLSISRGDELGVLAEGLQLMREAVMSRDISIRRLAYEDTLTGLMNRTAFSARLTQTLEQAGGVRVGVAIINLHRFRRINEHLGYSVGDAVLTRTASRLAAVPSLDSAVARLAADEFAAFTRLGDGETVQTWGASLLTALSEPVVVEAQPIDVSATVGLAVSAAGSLPADDLLRCADLALEQARRDKRPIAVYEEASGPQARDQLSLLGELRHALEHDELRLYYQPKIEMATGRIAGAEVLLRWQHPSRGLLGPGAFIPFAEQTGFIRRITRWTLDRAMAQGAEWHRTGRALGLAVNISAEDLADVRLDARVAGLLSRHQLPPALLTLEITESGFIEDPESALGMLNALAALGVYLSIDDFGTGYSSLSHLARMPVHEVKIDRSFVQGLDSDAEYATVVRSAIDMGHSLGLKVVAEGIETEFAAQRLRAFGCDVAQGFLYAKPMSHDDLTAWLVGKEFVPVIAAPADFTADEVTDTLSLMTY